MTQEALKLALDYLESRGLAWNVQIALREALREHAMREVQRLGQEIEQEPVAKVVCNSAGQISMQTLDGNSFDISKYVGSMFYTTPPQRIWVDLTDEEIDNINYTSAHMLAREVLAKLKEKNT